MAACRAARETSLSLNLGPSASFNAIFLIVIRSYDFIASSKHSKVDFREAPSTVSAAIKQVTQSPPYLFTIAVVKPAAGTITSPGAGFVEGFVFVAHAASREREGGDFTADWNLVMSLNE